MTPFTVVVMLLGLLGSTTNAAILRYCALFEAPPLWPFATSTSRMVISSLNTNVTVLVAHIADINSSHIEGLDLDVRQTLSEHLEMQYGKTFPLDPSRTLKSRTEFDFTDTVIPEYGRVTYHVRNEGVHCAFVHHEEVDGLDAVTLTTSQWSTTTSSLTSHQTKKLMVLVVIVAMIHVLVFPALMSPTRLHPFYMNQGFWSCLYLSFTSKLTLSGSRYICAIVTGSDYTLLLNRWSLVDFTVSGLIVSVVYRCAVNAVSYDTPSAHITNVLEVKAYADEVSVMFCAYITLLISVLRHITSPPCAALCQDIYAALLAVLISSGIKFHDLVEHTSTKGIERAEEDVAAYDELVWCRAIFVLLLPCPFVFSLSLLDYGFNVYLPGVPLLGFFQDLRMAHTHVLLLDRWIGPLLPTLTN